MEQLFVKPLFHEELTTTCCTSCADVHKKERVCSEYAGFEAVYALFGWSSPAARNGWHPNICARHSPCATPLSASPDAAQRNAPAQIRDPGVEGVRIDPGGANRATESRERTTVYIYLPTPGIIPTGIFFWRPLWANTAITKKTVASQHGTWTLDVGSLLTKAHLRGEG